MKILINSPLMSDKIVKLLSDYNEKGIKFTFIKKSGIKIEFEVSGIDGQEACNLAKTLIKGTDYGKAIFFNVEEI